MTLFGTTVSAESLFLGIYAFFALAIVIMAIFAAYSDGRRHGMIDAANALYDLHDRLATLEMLAADHLAKSMMLSAEAEKER